VVRLPGCPHHRSEGAAARNAFPASRLSDNAGSSLCMVLLLRKVRHQAACAGPGRASRRLCVDGTFIWTSPNNASRVEGLDVTAGHGHYANAQGLLGLPSKIGSEEKAGDWLGMVCPLSVGAQTEPVTGATCDSELPDISATGYCGPATVWTAETPPGSVNGSSSHDQRLRSLFTVLLRSRLRSPVGPEPESTSAPAAK
jgi:hypothetical protein